MFFSISLSLSPSPLLSPRTLHRPFMNFYNTLLPSYSSFLSRIFSSLNFFPFLYNRSFSLSFSLSFFNFSKFAEVSSQIRNFVLIVITYAFGSTEYFRINDSFLIFQIAKHLESPRRRVLVLHHSVTRFAKQFNLFSHKFSYFVTR